ncbi:elongation factor 1-gamma isoform X2 [Dermatophagoides farinae]|uniref:elongation factor 1-gamma isoform X2 n=1 Tax=Dermatophagoides farinae TaxID=6954 RepID=UPI003F63BA63
MRLDFQHKLLRIGYRNIIPFSNINPGLNISAGIEGILIQVMADYFNFTIKFIEIHDEGHLERINGTWTGLIGHIQDGQFDMAIGAISINFNRLLAVNFIEPHYVDSFSFTTNPAVQHVGFDVLIRPFRREVWFLMFSIFIISLLFQQFENQMLSITNIVSRHQSLSLLEHNIFWINLCLLFRQPYLKLAEINFSSKIFVIIWAIVALILTNSYAGGLCSILAIPTEHAIDTVEKLAMECQQKHIITLGIDTDYYTSLKDSQNPTLRDIGQHMEFVSDRDEAIQMILSSKIHTRKYAFPFSYEQILFTKIMIGWPRLYLPPYTESFFPLFYGIPVSKTFIYIQEFNQIIKCLIEAGLPIYWRSSEIFKIIRNRSKVGLEWVQSSSYANKRTKNQQFSMLHVKIILHLYLITLAMAIITLISEIFIHFRLLSKLTSNINKLFDHAINMIGMGNRLYRNVLKTKISRAL